MRPIDAAVLKKLDLVTAIHEEAVVVRNLIPEEPGWSALAEESRKVADYVANLARRGPDFSPERESIARKAGNGVRPIAYWGFEPRILYRALAKAAVASMPGLDRSIDAYLSFTKAPLLHARGLQNAVDRPDDILLLLFFVDNPIEYVVKSDLTSFYQFIDHAVLADELIAQGADYGVVEVLVELLGEVQGRSRGLPQLLDASDLLSEVYVDKVERRLLTQGYAVWRYNDDFRIACRDFPEALAAIEALDSAARDVGLAISEFKTRTYSFLRYALEVSGQKESDVGAGINPDEVEDVAGDYSDDFEADEEAAIETILSAKSSDLLEGDIDLRSVKPDKIRIIRRAIAALVRSANPAALERVEPLLAYIPFLTPTLVRYLQVVAEAGQQGEVAQVVDRVLEEVSLNEWQRQWFLDLIRRTNLLDAADEDVPDSRINWVSAHWKEGSSEPLRGEAFRTLASSGRIAFMDAVAEAESAPDAVKGTYLTGAVEALSVEVNPSDERRLNAIAGTNVIHRIIIEGR